MEFETYVKKPLPVEAVLVTKENIAEIAEMLGKLRHDQDGEPYIYVDRRVVPIVFKVRPGFWFTKLGDTLRCYHPDTFAREFVLGEPEVMVWVDYLNKKTEEAKQQSTTV